MHGVQWSGLGELPNHLFGLPREWFERPLGDASSASGPRADQHDPVYALSRDRVCNTKRRGADSHDGRKMVTGPSRWS